MISDTYNGPGKNAQKNLETVLTISPVQLIITLAFEIGLRGVAQLG